MRAGHGVYVPFGRQVLQGVALQLTDVPGVADPREILSLIDSERLITPQQAELARWIAEYYLAPAFSAVALFLPPGFERRARRLLRPVELPAAQPDALSDRARTALTIIQEAGEIEITELARQVKRRALRSGNVAGIVRLLLTRGLIEERYALAPPKVREKTETSLALGKPAPEVEAAIAAWPASARSVLPRLLDRVAAGPLEIADARRLAGGRAALTRALERTGVVVQEGERLRATAAAGTLREMARSLARTRSERAQVATLRTLLDGPRSEPSLRAEAGATGADIEALRAAGLVRREVRHIERDPLAAEQPVAHAPAATLTPQQARAYAAIAGALDAARTARRRGRLPERAACFLLHGVTGSGKTEVYLAAVEHARRLGGRAIVLVPEIALAPQTVRRFNARMPGRVAVLHSALTPGEAYDQWQRVRRGEADVVIGSRSALFAPAPALELIVVDEEHEWTYKQSDPAPRYHVRDVVERYCRLTGAVAVFGSATPDLVTAARARAGRYRLLELPQRVQRVDRANPAGPLRTVPLPSVEVVDMREELRHGNRSVFSRALAAALDEALADGDQAMLFLNRRGAAVYVCRACGEAAGCPRCSVALTYHSADERLRCHECGHVAPVPDSCVTCGDPRIAPMGLGTQRLEREVERRFPRARTLRWDRDTAAGRDGHRAILDRFLRGAANVLVGTQTIAKGLDLPAVTLVGVVNADLSLRLPDFTGPERTFQLLTQVAGRAGRGPRGGRVLVQTYSLDHPAIAAAAAHDYQAFFEAEIAARAPFDYPPAGRLVRLLYADSDPERGRTVAGTMADLLRTAIDREGIAGLEVLGPTPPYVTRRRGRWRWQITLRGADATPLLRRLSFPRGWTVDVDPVSLL